MGDKAVAVRCGSLIRNAALTTDGLLAANSNLDHPEDRSPRSDPKGRLQRGIALKSVIALLPLLLLVALILGWPWITRS